MAGNHKRHIVIPERQIFCWLIYFSVMSFKPRGIQGQGNEDAQHLERDSAKQPLSS